MFCTRCGKYNVQGATECKYCGNKRFSDVNVVSGINSNRAKNTEGVLLALFLGVLGLIIGLLIYPSNSYERQTFLSGWTKTFVATLIIGVLLVVFTVGCVSCTLL